MFMLFYNHPQAALLNNLRLYGNPGIGNGLLEFFPGEKFPAQGVIEPPRFFRDRFYYLRGRVGSVSSPGKNKTAGCSQAVQLG